MTQAYDPFTYYRFSSFAKNWVATCGIMQYCQQNRCYWVLDIIASYVSTLPKFANVDYLLIIEVTVASNQTATLTIKQEEGKGYRILVQQCIEYTDLQENLRFWAINESSGGYDPTARTVVLLPEEY